MANTVSLCMIVKNEIANLENLLNDVCPVLEQVVLVDTGSTDGTVGLIKKLQEQYSNLELFHYIWTDDFSAARNYSFSKANHEWVFWLDGDDRINSSDLKKFKDTSLADDSVDVWMLDYNYAQLPSGEPAIMLGRERFIRRSLKPTWQGAIHETINIFGMRTKHYYGLEVRHNRIGKVIDYNRNLRILEKEYQRNPHDPRTAYYYGKELFDHIDPRGIEVLERYLQIEFKYWDDEINARFRLGKHYLVNNRLTEAVYQAERIYHLDQTRLRAEGYWLMGSVEQKLNNYKAAIRWFKWCLDDPPGPPRVLSKEYYTWNPLMRLVECYLALNDTKNAFKHVIELEKHLLNHPEVEAIKAEIRRRNTLARKSPLLVLEFGRKLRDDSYVVGVDVDLDSITVPELDGIGYYGGDLPSEVIKLIKATGFLWSHRPLTRDECRSIQCNFLCVTEYKGKKVYSYIKEDPLKPSMSFQNGDDNFGPYRIRITNLKMSAIKNGFKVRDVDEHTDFYVGVSIRGDEKAVNKVLDVCEWVSDYSYKGIQHADMVCVCSDELYSLFKDKKLHQNVFVVDDHFEYTAREWL